jgi:hypothetical protein
MNLYLFDIGERARVAARFIGQVRAELQMAWLSEKASRKITQQQIAKMLGLKNRSVINRQLMGFDNLTLRRVAELAWALGWEIVFYLRKTQAAGASANPGGTVQKLASDGVPKTEGVDSGKAYDVAA